MEEKFELAIGRYRCYYNRETKKYDVWNVIGKYIISCTQLSACKSIMNALDAEDKIILGLAKQGKLK